MVEETARRVQLVIASAIVIHLLLVASWDLYCVYRYSGDFTVSAVIREWSVRYPLLPFAVGLVIGHIFWGRPVGDRG